MASNWKQILKPSSIYDQWGLSERSLDTKFCHLRIGFSANPAKDDNWALTHSVLYGGFDSSRWRREQGIDYHAYAGQRIWPLISKDLDCTIDINGEDWTIFRIIDLGIRHPTVCLWCAVNAKGDRHFFREYYANDRSISMNCNAIISLSEERVEGNYIDPSTRKRSNETLKPLISIFEENGLYCIPADNSFAGYDSVANGILSSIARKALREGVLPQSLASLNPDKKQLLTLADAPAITFDLRFTSRCFEECCNLRWQQSRGDLSQKAEPEKPVDKDDDGPDCVRYAMQSGLYYVSRPSSHIKFNFGKLFTNKRKTDSINDSYNKRQNRAYA